MIKKLKYILFIALVLLPIKTFAASVSINCPESVIVGDDVVCDITAINETLSGIESSIVNDGMRYKSSKNLTNSDMFLTSETEFKGVFEITNEKKLVLSYTFETVDVGIATLYVDCKKIVDGVDFETMSCDDEIVRIMIIDENNESDKDNELEEDSEPNNDNESDDEFNENNVPNIDNVINNNFHQITTKSDNAFLKLIELSSGNIEFNENIFEYDIVVGSDVEKITINSETKHSKAKIETIGNLELDYGINVIVLKVTAEDGITTKEYILNVDRVDKILSDNKNIKSLKIVNYDIDFDSNILKYNLSIKNETTLDINVELESSLSSYEIIGNSELKDGSIVKIKVIAEDRSSKIYEIKIDKNKAHVNKIIIICLIIIILLSILFIFKKRKRNNK